MSLTFNKVWFENKGFKIKKLLKLVVALKVWNRGIKQFKWDLVFNYKLEGKIS